MDNFETYEYIIVPKNSRKKTLKKLLFISLYVVFVLAWFLFGINTPFPALLALIPITLWMLVFATWRFVNVEYEYSVTSGVITFSKIYGGRSRKTIGELDIRHVCELLRLSDPFTERRLDGFDPEAGDDFLSSRTSETAYAAIYTDEDGTKCVVYLEVLPMLMKSFKIYNSAVVKKLEEKGNGEVKH